MTRVELTAAIREAVIAWNTDPDRKIGDDVSAFIADWLIDHEVIR